MIVVHRTRRRLRIGILVAAGAIFAAGCGAAGKETPAVIPPAATASGAGPVISDVRVDRTELPRYESIEMVLTVEAEYSNPYDAREVSLDGYFSGPDGIEMKSPGFWDGQSAWRIRFTPSREGQWTYRVTAADKNGSSVPAEGSFMVTPSQLHGWVRAGNLVDPAYSSRYLAYDDGTPFYGIGHCDAWSILTQGFSIDTGVALFETMKTGGENYVVWWPLYMMSPVGSSYDKYSVNNLGSIDAIVRDAQAKGVQLVFTVWAHPDLRDATHSLAGGRWESNGFHKLGDMETFFASEEAWAWQANLYRYMIARWGYSPAIGMWQTVSEINLTNAYGELNPWHAKVNAFFAEHDPYRHPTTASYSGEGRWPEGWANMDIPQVHLYDFAFGGQDVDAVHAAQVIAEWTAMMWNAEAKPNWVGEFGVPGNVYYPELFHNSIWAALAAGAAATPAEWNSGSWMEMTPEMLADTARLAQFLEGIPLVKWNPSALKIESADPRIRGWGVAGEPGGLFWIQDFTMEGESIGDVRAYSAIRSGVTVEIAGLTAGDYIVMPFDTRAGAFLEPIDVACGGSGSCGIALPDFQADMAFRIERA
ncbi:MAG: DUF5060 domain-containing protein [Anaerolineales bacterium]|nr:DUF5060 domain-containing protein [Anaerolineales bacterium]